MEEKKYNAIIRVHRPVLTDEERKEREEKIKEALIRYARVMYQCQGKAVNK